jgi:hypothetical protein
MKNFFMFAYIVASSLVCAVSVCAQAQSLPAPKFHHLQLNSVDPDTAMAFYVKEFPSTSTTTWEGMPALASPIMC